MLVDSAAERYATALFELAKEQGKVADIDAEMNKVALLSLGQRALSRALLAPDVASEVKASIVRKVFGASVSPLVVNFLQVLTAAGRFAALPDVARRFHGMMQDERGEVKVDVDTAVDLGAEVKTRVVEQVARHTGRVPSIQWHVDSELLGGIVVRIADNIIDYSVKSQLHELRERLLR